MSNTLVKADASKLYRKLNEYRNDEKYCDVKIKVDGITFPCHRIVLTSSSDYFDRELEDVSIDRLVVPDIPSTVFRIILNFVYTAKLQIEEETASAILEASEKLGLHYIEEMCVVLIDNKFPIGNIFCLLSFANKSDRFSLLELLAEYAAKNFVTLCEIEDFLEVSYDVLKIILQHLSECYARNDDIVLHFIIRWIRHNRNNRFARSSGLQEFINFKNVSPKYMEIFTGLMFESLSDDQSMDVGGKCKSVSCNMVSFTVPERDAVENQLQVYILSENKQNACHDISVYTVDTNSVWSKRVTLSSSTQRCWNVKNTCTESDIYRLYCRGDLSYFDESLYHLFCFYSVDGSFHKSLSNPPICKPRYELCTMQNTSYLYYPDCSRAITKTTYSNFTNAEISLGMFRYNIELDKWFPIPEMNYKPLKATIASQNQVLYLLGGRTYPTIYNPFQNGQAQRFDYRQSRWDELPFMKYRHVDGAACSHEGKIYIMGGKYSSKIVEIFDPVAGKWQMGPSMNNSRMNHRLISFRNYIWAIGNDECNLDIEVFNSKTNKWSEISTLSRTVHELSLDLTRHEVLDAIVSKHVPLQ